MAVEYFGSFTKTLKPGLNWAGCILAERNPQNHWGAALLFCERRGLSFDNSKNWGLGSAFSAQLFHGLLPVVVPELPAPCQKAMTAMTCGLEQCDLNDLCAGDKVLLKSSQGEIFEVEPEVACMSTLVRSDVLNVLRHLSAI